MYFFPIPARTFSELRFNPPMTGTYRMSWNDPAFTVDGLPNSLLRHVPNVITGVNSTDVLRIAPPAPGIQITAMNPDMPTARAHEWNFTIEHEIVKDTVLRAGLIGTAGRKLEMMELFNRNPVSNYVWFATTGLPLPTGTYADTARRAYDQTTIGDIRVYSKFGYSNFSGIQLEAERRFSKGVAFQLFYVLSNSMSTGATPSQGGDFTQNAIDQPDRFLPGTYPSSVEDRVRFYRYSRDGDIPKHRIRFNYLVRSPVRQGQEVLRQHRQWSQPPGWRMATGGLWQHQQPLVLAAGRQLGACEPAPDLRQAEDQRLPRRRLLRRLHVVQRLPAGYRHCR